MTQLSLFTDYEGEPVAPLPRSNHRQVRKGFVYLIHGYDDVYKIGRAVDAEQRFRAMTKLPFPTTVVHRIDCEDCVEAEGIIHTYHAPRRLHGEWFRLSLDYVAALRRVDALPMFAPLHDPKNAEVLRAYCVALPFDFDRALAHVLPEYCREHGLREAPAVYVA